MFPKLVLFLIHPGSTPPPSKALWPRLVTPSGTVKFVNAVFKNASAPIEVMLPSNSIEVRLVHEKNAFSGTALTPAGKLMAVSAVHDSKARVPMLVTLCGIEMLRSSVQRRKASSGMDCTPALITTEGAHGYAQDK